jgi:hypothetical protein
VRVDSLPTQDYIQSLTDTVAVIDASLQAIDREQRHFIHVRSFIQLILDGACKVQRLVFTASTDTILVTVFSFKTALRCRGLKSKSRN